MRSRIIGSDLNWMRMLHHISDDYDVENDKYTPREFGGVAFPRLISLREVKKRELAMETPLEIQSAGDGHDLRKSVTHHSRQDAGSGFGRRQQALDRHFPEPTFQFHLIGLPLSGDPQDRRQRQADGQSGRVTRGPLRM